METRLELLQKKEIHQQQLATVDCFISLSRRQEEAMSSRNHALHFFKDSTNRFMFFRTMEHCLQALFHRALTFKNGFNQLDDLLPANTVTHSSDTATNSIGHIGKLICALLIETDGNPMLVLFSVAS